MLNTICCCRETFDSACNLTFQPNVIDQSGHMHCVTQIRQAAWEAYEFLQKEAMVFEDLLQVSHRWTPDMTKWHDEVKYIQIRDYQLSVDKLEALVVQ